MEHRQKMVQIVTSSTLRMRVKDIFRKTGIKSFTSFIVSGEGESGVQSGHFDSDSNILFMTLVPEENMNALIEELNKDIKRGYHYFIVSLDAELHSSYKLK